MNDQRWQPPTSSSATTSQSEVRPAAAAAAADAETKKAKVEAGGGGGEGGYLERRWAPPTTATASKSKSGVDSKDQKPEAKGEERRTESLPLTSRRGYNVQSNSRDRSSRHDSHYSSSRSRDDGYYEDRKEEEEVRRYRNSSSSSNRGRGYDRRSSSEREEGEPYRRHRSASYANDEGRGYDDEDWKCSECFTWNYPDEKRCARCDIDHPLTMDGDRKRSNNSVAVSGNNDSDGSMDEFGRDAVTKKKKSLYDKDAWPPCFDDNSGDFVLDARSGMFYEAISNFFYDPTSKLYYSNLKQAYFSYNVVTKKYTAVPSSADATANSNAAAASESNNAGDKSMDDHSMLMPNGANNLVAAEPRKQGIAIKLTTAIPKQKSDKKRKNKDASTMDAGTKVSRISNLPSTTKGQKQNVANMEKWSERACGPNKSTTKTGKPICWVCKRKFPTLEKLQQHEEKSALHKENLAKQQQQAAAKPSVADTNGGGYVDRAKYRRNMHGPELVLPVSAGAAADVASNEKVLGDDAKLQQHSYQPLDGSVNIGHQMLQKLGWKSGAALGRGDGGEHQTQQQAALAQDWDRIENLASKNQSAIGDKNRRRR